MEFSGEDDIFSKYGLLGIIEYHLHGGNTLISDDTQMTLFNVNDQLFVTTRGILVALSCRMRAT